VRGGSSQQCPPRSAWLLELLLHLDSSCSCEGAKSLVVVGGQLVQLASANSMIHCLALWLW
jgi:hypothetical protein